MHVLKFGVAAAALVAGNAWATTADASEWYGVARIGQSTNTEVSGIPFDDGMSYGVGLGTSIGPIRVEGAVDRIQGDLNFGGPAIQGDALDWHVNAYLDLPVGDNASLFAGAGVDYVQAEANIFGFSVEGDGTGYNLAVGGAYRFSERLIGEAQFRRVEADLSTDFGDVDLSSDQITVGLRFEL